jgi:ribosome-associated toxin RatA of RatAB toxin-antitoxin module
MQMRHIDFVTPAPGHTAAEIFPILSDFERYPQLTDAVRSVAVTHAPDGVVVSTWEVYFRTGILRWTEEDRFDPSSYTITFNQTEGDVEYFAGAWTLEDGNDGCTVRFTADLDLGIPALGSILEPIAERALKDNIRAILNGLLAAADAGAAVPLARAA